MNCELIKVCGMRDEENIRQVEALGIDLMGFIFWPRSSRYVAERPSYLPTRGKRVVVFVDEEIDTLMRIAEDKALDVIQLHGHETPAYVAQLQGRSVIKAFNIATAADFVQTKDYAGKVDYFLFDTKGKSVGGNGEKFDWSVLDGYSGPTPFLLSGGIGPDDADRVKAIRHPQCAGIDLNSRFELSPAFKDIYLLQEFLNVLNHE